MQRKLSKTLYLTSCVQDLAFTLTHHKVIDIFLKISKKYLKKKVQNSSEDAQVFQNPDSQETTGLLSKVILAPCVLHFPFPISQILLKLISHSPTIPACFYVL